MKDWLALRDEIWLTVAFAIPMLILWLLVSNGILTFLVPEPDNIAEQFVSAVAAHRYEGAWEMLNQEQQKGFTPDLFNHLTQQLAQTQPPIENADASGAQQQGETAVAKVQVRMTGGKQETLQFPLKLENHVWKISSIEPLRTFTSGD